MRWVRWGCAAVVLVASACGDGGTEAALVVPPPVVTTSAPSAPERVVVTVELSTHDISLGVNFDDSKCLWRQTEWTIRDGAGAVMATGKLETGEGVVRKLEPLYECAWRMPRIEIAPADSYKLEVTTEKIAGAKRTASETFFRADTVRPVYLHFPRP
ncbi:hypothetical protein [Amycolatopsis magusensis]|uniref:hypothetical protein n=1 Tax=Amycolatopsis magusensis TaxID=882444 RepID=UPI0024A81568|nr:hypothetical protein [Amycolatopsis magusensis]MDI5974640.1 hypothetical protein [Amycolatopsis magusensis]